jgi:ribonuclease R
VGRSEASKTAQSEFEGIVSGHRDGHGFISRDDGQPDVYLSAQEMRAVLHMDRVRASVVRLDRKGRPEGRVLSILDRRKAPIIGRLLNESGVWLLAPEDRRYGQDVLIPKNAVANAVAGQIVAVELTEPPSMYSQPVGRVTEVLGEIDDPGMEIEIAVRKYEVPHRFSAPSLAQAAALPERIRAIDRRARVDLTDIALVTIDGEDARDFDDAVYCEPARVGRGRGWRLVVAIADVSHYVKPNEALDEDAFERATSVYFPRRVIPMLPEKISNGLCSLNPLEDRLAMVCDMLIDSKGEVSAYQFFPAVICSQARMTYSEVAAILGNTRGPEAQKRVELLPRLLALHEVYRALLSQRAKRGAIDFESTETQIVCDDNGRIEKIVPRTRTEAHRLIEEAMLAANVCSADFIARSGHPALYRVHEGPTPEKRVALQAYLRSLGLGLALSDEPKPAELQAIAQATKDRVDAAQIHTMLLRSMQQAIYTGTNSGHFGLAYEAYTHFTSPIRRYPDLLVHRVIKAILAGKRYALGSGLIKLASQPRPFSGRSSAKRAATSSPEGTRLGAEAQAWESVGAHCSANERRADEASRDVEAWLKCRFMRDRLGEEYSGTVSAATSFGLFVQLDALYVEGLVHITELGGEYFRFDELRQELRGDRSGQRYAVGSRVRVQVSRVDLDGRKIDFRLVQDRPEPLRPARPRQDRREPPALSDQNAIDDGGDPLLQAILAQDRSVKARHKSLRASGVGAAGSRGSPTGKRGSAGGSAATSVAASLGGASAKGAGKSSGAARKLARQQGKASKKR